MISVLSDYNIEGYAIRLWDIMPRKIKIERVYQSFRLLKIDDESFMDGYIIARKFISGKKRRRS